MVTKVLDSKGRLALGPAFANRVVIVDDSDSARIVITPAVVVPEHEVWLYKNRPAHEAVQRGIEEAELGRLAKNPPNLGTTDGES